LGSGAKASVTHHLEKRLLALRCTGCFEARVKAKRSTGVDTQQQQQQQKETRSVLRKDPGIG